MEIRCSLHFLNCCAKCALAISLLRDFESCQEVRGSVWGVEVWGPVQGFGSRIRGLVLEYEVPFRYAYKALIWVPKLHGPKIDKTMSKLL